MTFDEFFDKQNGTRTALMRQSMSDSARNEYHSGDPEHDCDKWAVIETTNDQRDFWVCEVCGEQLGSAS